jgi:hypothetical protein
VSRWILYGFAGLFAVVWFFYYYGEKTAGLVWNAAAPIVRPALAPMRLLAAPAMKIARVLQTPLTVRRARGLLCECESCQTRYVIGTNAVVVTFQQALAQFQGSGSMFVLGGSVSSVPDTVGLIFGESSWPVGGRIRPDGNVIPDEVAAAWRAGERREWQCDRCKRVQEYRWPT